MVNSLYVSKSEDRILAIPPYMVPKLVASWPQEHDGHINKSENACVMKRRFSKI